VQFRHKWRGGKAVCGHNLSCRTSRASPVLIPGEIVDQRYEVLQRVGAGSFAIVYKARDLQLDRITALKVLHAEKTADIDMARFLREAQLVSEMRHRNIVSCYRLSQWNGIVYAALEYVEGRSLLDLFADGKMPWRESVRLALQVCQGMQHSHSLGIVHRDLTPNNVLITTDEVSGQAVAQILDFGLARTVDAGGINGQKLTQTGHCVGTVAYMSPECCSGLVVDGRADIYSLGCILYESMAGNQPFIAATPFDLMRMHVETQAPLCSLSVEEADYPDGLDDVLLKAMAKSPEERYQSMREMAADLECVLAKRKPSACSQPPGARIRNALRVVQIGFVLSVLIFLSFVFVPVPLMTKTISTFVPKQNRVMVGISYATLLRSMGLNLQSAALINHYARGGYAFVDAHGKSDMDSIDAAIAMSAVAAIPDALSDFSDSKLAYQKVLLLLTEVDQDKQKTSHDKMHMVFAHLLPVLNQLSLSADEVMQCVRLAKMYPEYSGQLVKLAEHQLASSKRISDLERLRPYLALQDLASLQHNQTSQEHYAGMIVSNVLMRRSRTISDSDILCASLRYLYAAGNDQVTERFFQQVLIAYKRTDAPAELHDKAFVEYVLSTIYRKQDRDAAALKLMQEARADAIAASRKIPREDLDNLVATINVESVSNNQALSAEKVRALQQAIDAPRFASAYNEALMLFAETAVQRGMYLRASSILGNVTVPNSIPHQIFLLDLARRTHWHLGMKRQALAEFKEKMRWEMLDKNPQLQLDKDELRRLEMDPVIQGRQPEHVVIDCECEFEPLLAKARAENAKQDFAAALKTINQVKQFETRLSTADREMLYAILHDAYAGAGNRAAAKEANEQGQAIGDAEAPAFEYLTEQIMQTDVSLPQSAVKKISTNIERMEKCWNRALNLSLVYVRLAQLQSQIGQLDAAIATVEHALFRYPNSQWKLREYAELARLQMLKGNTRQALLAVEHADGQHGSLSDDDLLEFHLAAAQAFSAREVELFRKELDKCDSLLEKMKTTRNAGNLVWMGDFNADYWNRTGQSDLQIQRLTAALNKEPNGLRRTVDCQSLAVLLSLKGELTAAYNVLRDSLKQDPDNVVTLMRMSQLQMKRGHSEQSRELERRAFKIDPAGCAILRKYLAHASDKKSPLNA
jgi:tRNA A-37 threonylcarbamoyl transferase component Bud32/tetratricopeptide (TPR) repeat protein